MITASELAGAVAQHLAPALSNFGLRAVSQSGFSTRFEGQEVFVQVDYDAGRTHELNLWVGQKESPEPPFTLADLLRATDCPPDLVSRVDLIQMADAAVLERQLARCTELLVAYGSPFLQGDSHAFADATGVAVRECTTLHLPDGDSGDHREGGLGMASPRLRPGVCPAQPDQVRP